LWCSRNPILFFIDIFGGAIAFRIGPGLLKRKRTPVSLFGLMSKKPDGFFSSSRSDDLSEIGDGRFHVEET
jgi:hypothetical protein